jgi:hypothetical protein
MFIEGRITLWTFNTDVIFLVDILHKLDTDKNSMLYDKKSGNHLFFPDINEVFMMLGYLMSIVLNLEK